MQLFKVIYHGARNNLITLVISKSRDLVISKTLVIT